MRFETQRTSLVERGLDRSALHEDGLLARRRPIRCELSNRVGEYAARARESRDPLVPSQTSDALGDGDRRETRAQHSKRPALVSAPGRVAVRLVGPPAMASASSENF